ncbi:uncharacterized protein V1516DRAFT_677820 [Lipomyces oligophaga]|uniref:uncharacterized protein n=1 Tax=Lipomyces oligophaga TaxID=45792 RepID=UPI0034CFBCFA
MVTVESSPAANLTHADCSKPCGSSMSCSFLNLPTELRVRILSYTDGATLLSIAATCHSLRETVSDYDDIWRAILHPLLRPSILAGEPISCAPYNSFRELYYQLRQFIWFTPGVWHGDREAHGSICISRYDPATGHIIAHELFVQFDRSESTISPWSYNPTVLVDRTELQVMLSPLPIIKFTSATKYNSYHEIPQPRSPRGMTTNFFHATSIPLSRRYSPQMRLWPPPLIPSDDRTRNESPTGFRGSNSTVADASQNLFRLRRWISFANSDAYGVIMGERVETFSKLDPALYTPDDKHPFKGIWLGDYSSHGGEFILFHQPSPTRLEAIKLTGDPNVPRGEFTFVIDDLSHTERIATESEWPGARVVAGQGQLAGQNFTNSCMVETQLIIIDSNKVASYWIELFHISLFRRIDVAGLLAGR